MYAFTALSIGVAVARQTQASSTADAIAKCVDPYIDVAKANEALTANGDVPYAAAIPDHPGSEITYQAASAGRNGSYRRDPTLSCVTSATIATRLPDRADVQTWNSGLYPSAPRPRVTLNTANTVSVNAHTELRGSVSCERPGIQTVTVAESHGGPPILIGSTTTRGAFTMPWRVSGPAGNLTLQVTVQGSCGTQSQLFPVSASRASEESRMVPAFAARALDPSMHGK
jgi:hypothetical protein